MRLLLRKAKRTVRVDRSAIVCYRFTEHSRERFIAAQVAEGHRQHHDTLEMPDCRTNTASTLFQPLQNCPALGRWRGLAAAAGTPPCTAPPHLAPSHLLLPLPTPCPCPLTHTPLPPPPLTAHPHAYNPPSLQPRSRRRRRRRRRRVQPSPPSSLPCLVSHTHSAEPSNSQAHIEGVREGREPCTVPVAAQPTRLDSPHSTPPTL